MVWPAALIPSPAAWHPCLLTEVRSDNDDAAGGTNGCASAADPAPCAYGSYFWGDNKVCQRNLTYAPRGVWRAGTWALAALRAR